MKNKFIVWGLRSVIIAYCLPIIYLFWFVVEGILIPNFKSYSFEAVFLPPLFLMAVSIAAVFHYLEQPFRKAKRYKLFEIPIITILIIGATIVYLLALAGGSGLGGKD